MRVFISWSGDKSRHAAIALREWLPAVINTVEPFVSSKDIYAGSRWQAEIAAQLDATSFGIVCVTAANQGAPWLNFEAGALAKSVASSRVVPLALDLKPSDIKVPLGQFHAQPATKEGIVEILESLNSCCDPALDDALLKRATEKWWPELEEQLERIKSQTEPDQAIPERSERELLEEVLDTVRSLARGSEGSADTQGLQADHPLVVMAEARLSDGGIDGKVLRAVSRRAIGIRTDQRVPDELRELIEESAREYGIAVEYLPELRRSAQRKDDRNK